ncbi:MAG: hypothetical protein KJ645_02790, partial [Planctomycetes bacterium]|nr:hypothetical protein [Planctomycetota bacterium]
TDHRRGWVYVAVWSDGQRFPARIAHIEYPDWISTENNTYTDEDGGHVIYCVGVAAAGKNPAMRWDTAKNNALLNISRILNVHIRGMFTAYAREAGDFYDEATLSSIQNNEQVSRSLTESFISGAICINKYLTKDKKEAYVLFRLDLDNDMLQTMSDRAKAAVRENFAAKVKAQTDEALNKMDEAATALRADLAGAPPVPAGIGK